MRMVLIGLGIWAVLALPFALILIGAAMAGRRDDAGYDYYEDYCEMLPSSPASSSENDVTSPTSVPERLDR